MDFLMEPQPVRRVTSVGLPVTVDVLIDKPIKDHASVVRNEHAANVFDLTIGCFG
jgi:hypothetical protein